jgi:hypothetical protein
VTGRDRRSDDPPATIVVLVRFPLTVTYLLATLIVVVVIGLHPWR